MIDPSRPGWSRSPAGAVALDPALWAGGTCATENSGRSCTPGVSTHHDHVLPDTMRR
ncbi:hypothetical protein [Tomitella gaofuii]|uniref:hypothetical protein n=1 Tax=Tomitella gaofuii TaxID=2760083 RepID=UPI0015F8C93F|nr:hypothetical protein [Tomitella gaofuii]